ncbi:18439_t:CDS:2, partial [Racocetra persica]
ELSSPRLKITYMTNPAQEHISQITNHKRIKYLDISNRDLSGPADLKEFTALIKYLNCENNPLSAKNLENLSSEQFGNQGNQQQQQNAQYLQTLIQQGGSSVKSEDNNRSGNNVPLLIGGLVIFGISALVVGLGIIKSGLLGFTLAAILFSGSMSHKKSLWECGLCKDYDNAMHFAMGINPEDKSPFPECGCRGICFECSRKKCQVCGNIKRGENDDFASDCKICGNCEQCVYCNNKTVCRKCAIAKLDKVKNQSEEIKNLRTRVGELEEKTKKLEESYSDVIIVIKITLLDELPPNGAIYHTDKFGSQREKANELDKLKISEPSPKYLKNTFFRLS